MNMVLVRERDFTVMVPLVVVTYQGLSRHRGPDRSDRQSVWLSPEWGVQDEQKVNNAKLGYLPSGTFQLAITFSG